MVRAARDKAKGGKQGYKYGVFDINGQKDVLGSIVKGETAREKREREANK